MNSPLTPDTYQDLVAAFQGGRVALGLPELEVQVLDTHTDGPDGDGDVHLTVRYAVTNGTGSDLEQLDVCTQLLNGQGLILEESRDTEEVTLPASETVRYEVTFWVKAPLLEPEADKVLVVIEVTARDFGQHQIGILEVPAATLTPVPLAPATLPPALRLVSGCLWKTEPDDDKDSRLEIKCLVQNLTPHHLPEVRLVAVVTDKKGREVTDAGTYEEVRPAALVTLSGSGYAKEHRFRDSKIEIALRGSWPIAKGLAYGEVPVRLRGRRQRAAPVSSHGDDPPGKGGGLTVLVSAYMKRARYDLGDEDQRAALQAALEEDSEGTLAALIDDLPLGDLEEDFRELIDLPPEVESVRAAAVRGDWEIRDDDTLVINLEADWILPLRRRPDDEDELGYAFSQLGYPALIFAHGEEEYGLCYDGDNGGDTSIEIQGDED